MEAYDNECANRKVHDDVRLELINELTSVDYPQEKTNVDRVEQSNMDE